MKYKILIIDGSGEYAEAEKSFLETNKYEVSVAENGASAINHFRSFEPDAVILDTALNDRDGMQVLKELRNLTMKPIIITSEKSEVFDKIIAFELGADDYIVKPGDLRETEARIKAVMRRYSICTAGASNETVKLDKMEISLQKYLLKLNDKSVSIPPKELELLYFLVSNSNRVFTRDQLLDKVWSFDYLGDSRTVDVHIKRIREKINGISDKWELKTVWGVGYKFELAE